MASPRSRLVEEVASLVSPSMTVLDVRNGWPALVELSVGGAIVGASLHVSRVGLSHRNRDDVERRYQNPQSCDPIIALAGTRPMLLGLWTQEDSPVLVAHDAHRRLGHGGTRVSFFVALDTLRTAAIQGWAEQVTSSDERILAFAPRLFLVFAEMFAGGVVLPEHETRSTLLAADVSAADPQSVERARRATSVLVRDSKFRRNVIAAYDGSCAMCGLQLGLVEGAHVYPASAPGSTDFVTNGIALCPNHHAAFDRHLVWIEPGSLRVVLHPDVHALAEQSDAARGFVELTRSVLVTPAERPADEMLNARYAFFGDAYAWTMT